MVLNLLLLLQKVIFIATDTRDKNSGQVSTLIIFFCSGLRAEWNMMKESMRRSGKNFGTIGESSVFYRETR